MLPCGSAPGSPPSSAGSLSLDHLHQVHLQQLVQNQGRGGSAGPSGPEMPRPLYTNPKSRSSPFASSGGPPGGLTSLPMTRDIILQVSLGANLMQAGQYLAERTCSLPCSWVDLTYLDGCRAAPAGKASRPPSAARRCTGQHVAALLFLKVFTPCLQTAGSRYLDTAFSGELGVGRYSADSSGQQDQRRLSGRTIVDDISEDESIPGSVTTEVEAALQVGSILCNDGPACGYAGGWSAPQIRISSETSLLNMQMASGSWQADIFALADITDNQPLSLLGFHLLKQSGLIAALSLNERKLGSFLRRVETGYLNNPYHNR